MQRYTYDTPPAATATIEFDMIDHDTLTVAHRVSAPQRWVFASLFVFFAFLTGSLAFLAIERPVTLLVTIGFLFLAVKFVVPGWRGYAPSGEKPSGKSIPMRLSPGDHDLTLATTDRTLVLRWDAVHGFRVIHNYLLLYIAPTEVVPVPIGRLPEGTGEYLRDLLLHARVEELPKPTEALKLAVVMVLSVPGIALFVYLAAEINNALTK